MTELEAGPGLDRLIAERLMGVREVRRRKGTYDLVVPGGVDQIDFVDQGACWSMCPKYSTDIAATMQAVNHVHAQGEYINISWQAGVVRNDPAKVQWWVMFRKSGTYASADTLPLAICLALAKQIAIKQ